MRVPLPQNITSAIANRALQNARSDAMARGWKSADFINPVSRDGFAGLSVSKKYLMYQEQGTKPRLMTELEGKLVPIKDPDGTTHVVMAKDVGKPGFVTLPGGVKVWRQQKWRHPGIKPTHLLRNSINQAVEDTKAEILDLMGTLVGDSEGES